MEIYFAAQPVTVTVPLLTSGGIAVTDATAASCRVLNAEGAVLATPSVELTAGAPTVEIEIPTEANQLADGQLRAYRQVEVTFEAAGNTYKVFEEYLIEAVDALRVPDNSFQTYADAAVLAAETSGLDEFNGADRRDRIKALINAHSTLSGLRFQVYDPRVDPYSRISAWTRSGQVNLKALTQEQFSQLPEHFVSAIRRAQLIEANEALDAFSVHRKRQQGLMSETIGESSMMFRSEKVLNIPVTRRSLDLLRGYLIWEIGIGRG